MTLIQVRYVSDTGNPPYKDYTYDAEMPVELGDMVEVPVPDGQKEAKVVKLSSNYTGPVKSVTRVLR